MKCSAQNSKMCYIYKELLEYTKVLIELNVLPREDKPSGTIQ